MLYFACLPVIILTYRNSFRGKMAETVTPLPEEEVLMTPHPYYDHCSTEVKSFIVNEILPVARQYAVVYHSHETAEESEEPFKHAYKAREHLDTCLALTNSVLKRTDESDWDEEFVEKDKQCLQMLKNFLLYQKGKYLYFKKLLHFLNR